VTVATRDGTSRPSPGSDFTYEDAGPTTGPVVTAVTPASGPPVGEDTVVILGSGFAGATEVLFGGDSAPIRKPGSTQLVVRTPPHAPGRVDVVVISPEGRSRPSKAASYRYLAPTPEVTNISPNSGSQLGGEPVTITGTGLADATVISFGGAEVPPQGNASDSSLTVITPEHDYGPVEVRVTTPDGTSDGTPYTFEAVVP
jgi:hypothetical protein